jgi:hypothetical protein
MNVEQMNEEKKMQKAHTTYDIKSYQIISKQAFNIHTIDAKH